MPTLPTFLVIGVAKAGTTALYRHLKAHPEVYMAPVKEPNFFSFDGTWPLPDWKRPAWVTTWEDYRALFEGVGDEKAIGEASPRYFHSPIAPAHIRKKLPEVRLVALLRHPVDRAFSHFMHMINSGVFDHRPFVPFFREKAQTRATWDQEPFGCYGLRHSLYYESLQRYFDTFPREHIRIYLFEEYSADPRPVLRDLYRFLGVDAGFVPDLKARYNPTHGVPKNQALHKTVMRPNPVKRLARKLVPAPLRRKVAVTILKTIRTQKPVLSDEIRSELVAAYREDILKVQDLIGRDLDVWLR